MFKDNNKDNDAYPNFRNIRSAITAASEILLSMFANYLKDVSALLAMMKSVRECNIKMYLEAEKALPLKLFAFGHAN